MRHRKAGRQLRRTSEQRLALLRNLAMSLIEHGAIVTTEAKAKELRPFVEKLITKAKRGTLHARRLAAGDVHVRRVADSLFRDVGPAFATRAGGYTRILKTGHRKGDGAELARIELIGLAAGNGAPPSAKTAQTARAKAPAKAAAAKGAAKGGAAASPPAGKTAKKAPAKGGTKG
jgi:large subunit ribosomal protein L17